MSWSILLANTLSPQNTPSKNNCLTLSEFSVTINSINTIQMERLMSLNGYVRQLKPRTENYIPPVDRVQNLLSETMDVTTDNASIKSSEDMLDKEAGHYNYSTIPKVDLKKGLQSVNEHLF